MQKRKTKILAIGDIHNDTGLVKRLAEKAKKEKVDLVILAGDITIAEQSTKGLIGPFLKAKKQVLLIPGNHETPATANFLAEMYSNTKNIHGYSFSKGNVGIFGAGSGDIGLFKLGDKEMFELLKRGNEKIKNKAKKIMVTHVHPTKTKMDKFSPFVGGSKGVRKAIEKFQPDIAICAHVHEAAGIEEKIGKTIVINVARKEKIFEI